MTKASASRAQRRRRKAEQKKAREEIVCATTKGVVSSIDFTFDPSTNEISFGVPVENTHLEASYSRPKAPKIINRIPLNGELLPFSHDRALLDNFDILIAIDTNTRLIAGRRISVVGIIIGQSVKGDHERTGVAWKCPFCVELTEVISMQEERIGWIEGLHALYNKGMVDAHRRVGLVVDAHLSDLKAINDKKQAVFGTVMLPDNVTLIYASADTGGEYLANTLIRGADRSATMVLDYLAVGRAALNDELLEKMPFKGRRIIFSRQPS